MMSQGASTQIVNSMALADQEGVMGGGNLPPPLKFQKMEWNVMKQCKTILKKERQLYYNIDLLDYYVWYIFS